MSAAQLVQPLANGALVLALDTDFDGCMAIVQRLATEEGVYLANSMNSLRLEGQKTLSIEIVQQFDWEVPDVVIMPGGNLGNVSAIGAGFDMMLELGLITKRPRIVVAQAAAANPLYLAYRNNWAFEPDHGEADDGVGDSDWQSGVDRQGHSHAAAVRRHRRAGHREAELADAAARADRTGMFNCPHTGVALAALEKLVARGEIQKTDRVIVISTANGLKFHEFKTAYHTGSCRACARYANPPVELPERLRRRAASDRQSPDHSRTGAAGVDRGGADRLSARRDVRRHLEVWKFGGASLADAAAIRKRPRLDRGAHRSAASSSRPRWRASPTCCSTARARAARETREAPHESRPNSCGGIDRSSSDLVPPGQARRKLLGTIDAAAREYRELCGAVGVLGHLEPRASDMLVSRGERLSAACLAAAIVAAKRRAVYVDAVDFVRTDGQHGGAAPHLPATSRRARRSCGRRSRPGAWPSCRASSAARPTAASRRWAAAGPICRPRCSRARSARARSCCGRTSPAS